MRSQIIAQQDFSAGQIDETALRSDDTPVMRAGLRRAENMRITNTRSLTRRPGRRSQFQTTGIVETVFPASGEEWRMALEPGGVTFRSADLSTSVTFTGAPWTLAQIPEISWVEEGGTIILAHQAFSPRAYGYDRLTKTWQSFPFSFASEPSGASRAPFYNFYLGSGVTMTPSARSGSITITMSAAVLNVAHEGLLFRYGERQLRIVDVTSATTATATVVEELPPSFRVTVNNVDGLQIGDVIEGVDSSAKGQVIAVNAGAKTFDVVLSKTWAGFTGTEIIAGPRSRMTFASQAVISPLASTIWDEPLMSTYRGWPGCVSKDQRRVIFARFPQLGPAIVYSATGTLNDFKVGADRTDAIFEIVPDNCTVLNVVGSADQFIFTDRGVYYIPVSTANPLIPGSIEFRLITDDPASSVRPSQTPEGLVFVNGARTRILALIGTGQSARPYIVEDATEYHLALIKSPTRITATNTGVSAPERYLYAVNDDGTLAVGRVQRTAQSKWLGWLPWSGAGRVVWACSGSDTVGVTVEYDTASGPVRFYEVFDDSATLDCSQPLASLDGGALLEVSDGVLLLTEGERAPISLGYDAALGWASGLTVSVDQNGWYRGDYAVGSTGALETPIAAGGIEGLQAGFNFPVVVEPFVPHAAEGQSLRQRMRPRRLHQVAATVLHSQSFTVAGQLIPFYRDGENMEEAAPLRSMNYCARVLGRDFDPRWTVEQPLPGALTLLELTAEVTI